jgi:monothiol glutaredoxin
MHGAPFTSHDVLQDEQLRMNIKEFSEWPTIPQVYMDKEFIGGSDIMLELHQSGQLVDKLKSVGIKSAVADESATAADKKKKS